MQLFLHLYSTISGRISFNNNFFAILKEQTKTKVKINFEENFYLEFTPINYSTYSNFLCEIKYEQNNLKCNSDNISIIKLDEENYYIIFKATKQAKISILNISEQEITLKGKRIVYGNNKLEIFEKNKYNVINIANNGRIFKLSEQQGIIFLFCEDGFSNNLHIINPTFNHIIVSADKFQIKNDEIQCIKNLKTFAKHQKIICYNIVTLKQTKCFIGYKVKPNIQTLPQIILPYAFMQCIEVEDYSLAQTFLDENVFVGKLNKAKVKNFFGDFYLVCTPQVKKDNNTICLIYKSSKQNTSKYFTFLFNEQNKITNIKPQF